MLQWIIYLQNLNLKNNYDKKIAYSLLFILIISSASFWVLVEGSKRSYLGFLHYKIARNIKEKEGDIYKNLNEWMLMNLFNQSSIDEAALPIADINSYGRLQAGYSACDGLADTYIRIGEFLNLKGYTISLYNKEFSSSPHTTAFFSKSDDLIALDRNPAGKVRGRDIFNSKSIQIIDSSEHISFIRDNESATFSDICNRSLDEKHLKYSSLQKINYSAFCNIKETSQENEPIDKQQNIVKRLYYKTLDLLPEWFLFVIHEQIVETFNDEDIFLKARHYDLFGNDELATKYYNKVISKGSISRIFFHGTKKVDLKDMSKWFLTRLENRNSNTIKPNPFSSGMFYRMYEDYVEHVKNYRELNNN